MAIRLLNKRDVDVAKARDRQIAVAEGLKLAQRVDGLREVSASEAVALETWRRETLSAITEDITATTSVRDGLQSEVKGLEERRALATSSLVERENAVQSREDGVAAEKEELKAAHLALDIRTTDVAGVENAAKEKLQVATVVHTQAKDVLAEASTIKANAEQTSRLADKTLHEAQANAATILANADEREGFVINRENAVAVREEQNRKDQIDLALGWQELKDRIATFERDLKRK